MDRKSPQELLFSIVVPVYNRPDEVDDLLKSLAGQTDKGFEVVIVEDGSTIKCEEQARKYSGACSLQYFYKDNEGRSPARNYGMDHARGDFFIFVDSDCILPSDYIALLRKGLSETGALFFGGPDAAHESFTPTQKAINYAMTSFLTTGGIRGGKKSMEKFVPRTFNMGFAREVYARAGGFREMFSEDIDMSTRIRQAGYEATLLRDVKVFHKRRGNLAKFWRQVHVFGMSRITLQLLYPGSLKAVHCLPATMTLGAAGVVAASFWQPWILIAPGAYLGALWIDGLRKMKSIRLATLGTVASVVQILGYGTGFLRSYFWKILLGHGRDIDQEVKMRKGK